MDPMHPYQLLPLFTAGLVLAAWLIGVHALMLAKPAAVQEFLKKFPRNQNIGQILLGIGLAWFWLLIAPAGLGKLSALTMDLGEFNSAKGLLQLLVPVSLVGAAFLKDPQSRLLVPIFAYAMLTASLFWVGMPYLFRDAVTWVTADQKRWTLYSLAGLGYGIATLVCALVFWRGY